MYLQNSLAFKIIFGGIENAKNNFWDINGYFILWACITLRDIVIDEKPKKAARIKIIFFPETYMSTRDRPYLDEMLQQLRKSKRRM